jgi:hypothetical protein
VGIKGPGWQALHALQQCGDSIPYFTGGPAERRTCGCGCGPCGHIRINSSLDTKRFWRKPEVIKQQCN